MRRVLFGGVVLLAAACAANKRPATARVNLTDISGGVVVLDVPANVPHYITFCDYSQTWSSAKWYLIRIDGEDQENKGPVAPIDEPNCYKTPVAYPFSAGTHSVDVLLVNHCLATSTEPLCTQRVPCPVGVSCIPPGVDFDAYGEARRITVDAAAPTGPILSGPPPSVLKGQVIR
jgi:hypothetical protein